MIHTYILFYTRVLLNTRCYNFLKSGSDKCLYLSPCSLYPTLTQRLSFVGVRAMNSFSSFSNNDACVVLLYDSKQMTLILKKETCKFKNCTKAAQDTWRNTDIPRYPILRCLCCTLEIFWLNIQKTRGVTLSLTHPNTCSWRTHKRNNNIFSFSLLDLQLYVIDMIHAWLYYAHKQPAHRYLSV